MFAFDKMRVVRIAQEAGAIIINELAHPDTLDITGKLDHSPVTQADLKANAHITTKLRALTPDIPILSEEMTPEEQRAIMKKGTYWCVDPLDGTKTAIKYAQHMQENGSSEQTGFGVLIALVKDGTPVFGVAHYPVEGAMVDGKPTGRTYYTSANGKAAYCDDGAGKPKRLRVTRNVDESLSMAAGYRGVAPACIAGKQAENHPAVGGSRILRAAEGAVDIGYMGNDGPISFGYWDLAAPHAILKAAGGELVTMPGDFHTHQQAGALRHSLPLRYDGGLYIEGKAGEPYLPACMAAGRDTLTALGMPKAPRQRTA